MVVTARPQISFREVARIFGQMLTLPATIFGLTVAATGDFWRSAAAYGFLRTFLTSPNGFWPWLAICLMSSAMTACFILGGMMMAKHKKRMTFARQCVRDNVPGGERLYQEEWRRSVRHSGSSFLIAGCVCLMLLVPPVVSLTAYQSMGPSGRLVHGKLIVHSKREQLQQTLKWMEDRGIFTPIKRGSD